MLKGSLMHLLCVILNLLQESFTPSQGIFDHTMASQGVTNSNIGWCTARGSVGAPMPIMQGQPNNFVGWMVQTRRVPNVSLSQHHIDQPMV